MVALVGVLVLGAGACSATGAEKSSVDDDAERAPASAAAAIEESPPGPVVTHRTERVRSRIPFTSQTRNTADLDRGVRQVSQPGRFGRRVQVVRVTLEDGVEVSREVLRKFVARKPEPRIVLRGTYVAPPPPEPTCDPNYTGACVPIASDVDCGGGSGNGPAYVYGKVEVVGSDIYDLDADGDGFGCD